MLPQYNPSLQWESLSPDHNYHCTNMWLLDTRSKYMKTFRLMEEHLSTLSLCLSVTREQETLWSAFPPLLSLGLSWPLHSEAYCKCNHYSLLYSCAGIISSIHRTAQIMAGFCTSGSIKNMLLQQLQQQHKSCRQEVGLLKVFLRQGGAFAHVLFSNDVWDVSLHRADNCSVECSVVELFPESLTLAEPNEHL